jgi:glycosyltransferase involved in cell wall biosynthesis
MKKLKIDFVIPIYNEEKVLENSICKLRKYLVDNVKNNWLIVIVENGSSDKSLEIAKNLSKKYSKIDCIHTDRKGRGYALKYALENSKADICLYMDVDLSTGLSAIQEAVLSMKKGYNLVIGSRYLDDSKAKRSIKRLILSKGYNLLVWFLFRTKIRDLQCGFKAVNQKIIKNILPKIKSNEWFFDTELIILSERGKYKIKEIPISWKENNNSKVKIIKTIKKYIFNSIKLKRRIKNESCINKS